MTPNRIGTAEFADFFHVKHTSVLRAYWERGNYFGYIPKKLENGRLSWPNPEFFNPDGTPKKTEASHAA